MRVGELGGAAETTARTSVSTVSAANVTAYAPALADAPTLVAARPFDRVGSWRLAAKRTIDVSVSLLVLLVAAPVFVLVAIGVRLSSPGPILFRQTRVGRDGRHFTMLKFRTFPVDHIPPLAVLDAGEVAVVPASLSPVRFGRLLRQTSFDELPQLVNVLRGDMSLVGPRPERPELVAALSHRIPHYHDRHAVPGGLTGHAQVLGLCGTTPIEERVAADIDYIDRWTLRRDFAILARTVPTLWRKIRAF
jgi:putative colanic acid biosynthesis UDP-glucose lipid carrier transferase